MNCAFPSGPAPSMWRPSATCSTAFEERHRVEYGHVFPDSAKEIVNVRVTGLGATPKITRLPRPSGGSVKEALVRTGACMFRVDDNLRTFDTAFYRRDRLPVEEEIAGPAIILQQDSTTVVRPVDTFRVDASGNIIIAITC
jgi:N-methylhydantoinase A